MSGAANPAVGGAASPAPRASLVALVRAEGTRVRRTWILPLTVMGPAGVTLLGVILFLLRGEYLIRPVLAGESTGWQAVVNQMGMIQVFALGLGATLLASMIADVEHRSDTWKQMFALPVSRAGVYVVKFAWLATLLACSSLLMAGGYAALMTWQQLGPLPWADLFRAAWLPWLASLPLLALQLLLSTALANQAAPIAAGVLTTMFGMGLSGIPEWLPWRLMTAAMNEVAGVVVAGSAAEAATQLTTPGIALVSGLWVLGLVLVGAVVMTRREIR